MSYGGHLSYRLVYNNLSNAPHNTMHPLKPKGVHCIEIRVISQRDAGPNLFWVQRSFLLFGSTTRKIFFIAPRPRDAGPNLFWVQRSFLLFGPIREFFMAIKSQPPAKPEVVTSLAV